MTDEAKTRAEIFLAKLRDDLAAFDRDPYVLVIEWNGCVGTLVRKPYRRVRLPRT